MKEQLAWLVLVLGAVLSIAGSLGCATAAMSSALRTNDRPMPLVTDTIVAIGRPDGALAQQVGVDAVAFIGKKNTYLLYKGGGELERVAQLKLDSRRMMVLATGTSDLYVKEKQVWGHVTLIYSGGTTLTADEKVQLEGVGFTAKGTKADVYEKRVSVEGLIYPPIPVASLQTDRLTQQRAISLYAPQGVKAPTFSASVAKVAKVPLIAAAVVTDIALTPLYLGIGTIILISAANH